MGGSLRTISLIGRRRGRLRRGLRAGGRGGGGRLEGAGARRGGGRSMGGVQWLHWRLEERGVGGGIRRGGGGVLLCVGEGAGEGWGGWSVFSWRVGWAGLFFCVKMGTCVEVHLGGRLGVWSCVCALHSFFGAFWEYVGGGGAGCWRCLLMLALIYSNVVELNHFHGGVLSVEC